MTTQALEQPGAGATHTKAVVQPRHWASLFGLLGLAAVASTALAAPVPLTLNDAWSDISWDRVPATEITLFYPGRLSFEWLNSSRHPGFDNRFFAQRRCNACHQGEERGLGDMMVKGSSDWLPGKQGALPISLQLAHDGEYLHVRLRWRGQANKPARAHQMLRYHQGQWQTLESPVAEEALTLMWDDGSIPGFDRQGCFLSCHLPQDGKPAGHRDGALETAYPAPAGTSGSKFLPGAVKGRGAGAKPLSLATLRQQLADGRFADVWQWRSATSGVIGILDDGFLLDSHYLDAPKGDGNAEGAVRLNLNPATGEPLWMFAADAANKPSLRRVDLIRQKQLMTLVEGVNTQAYDASQMHEGALLPKYYVAKGQRSDIERIEASWQQGEYRLTFKRRLTPDDPVNGPGLDAASLNAHATDKGLAGGRLYTFSIALHDNNASGRAHFVSFPIAVSLSPDGRADIVSTPLIPK